jgi:hypothetical protein
MTTFTRSLLFQIPGWVIAAVVLFGLRQWSGLSHWLVVGLFALWVIKILLFIRFSVNPIKAMFPPARSA